MSEDLEKKIENTNCFWDKAFKYTYVALGCTFVGGAYVPMIERIFDKTASTEESIGFYMMLGSYLAGMYVIPTLWLLGGAAYTLKEHIMKR